MNGQDAQDKLACQTNLVYILDVALRLLHPIMPFVTESIYQELPVKHNEKHLMMRPWPSAKELAKFVDKESESEIESVCVSVGNVRSVRARYGISPKQELNIAIKPANKKIASLIQSQISLIKKLANVENIEVGLDIEKPSSSSVGVVSGMEIYVILEGLVNFDAERARLQKELDSAKKDAAKFEKKLCNPGFLNNAKPEIIEKDKKKLQGLKESIDRLNSQIQEL